MKNYLAKKGIMITHIGENYKPTHAMRWDRVSFTGSDFHVLGEVEPTIEQAKGEKKHQDCVDIHIYIILYIICYILFYI